MRRNVRNVRGAQESPMEFPARACSKVAETNLNCPGLLSSTPKSRFAPVRLEDLKDLELEVDVARHLWLAVIAHICLVLPVIAICSLVRFW